MKIIGDGWKGFPFQHFLVVLSDKIAFQKERKFKVHLCYEDTLKQEKIILLIINFILL